MAHRSDEILKRLPAGPIVGAEIGVFAGRTSAMLLKREDLKLFMVDPWTRFLADGIVIASDEDQEKNLRNAKEITEFASNRRNIIRMTSMEAAEGIDDETLDFVFIDGDHSFLAVGADIAAWRPKLKAGGLLCGHDYGNYEYPFGYEVKRAVDGYVMAHGLALELGGDFTWFVKL